MRKINYNFYDSAFAMFVAWFIGFCSHLFYQVHFSGWGYVTDFSAVYSWTGLFALITAIIFVPWVIKLQNRFFSTSFYFPFFTSAAAIVSLSILLMPLTFFQPWEMGWYYYSFAVLIGLIFGFVYKKINSENFLNKSVFHKILAISFPILVQLFIFNLLPYVAPGVAYKYFGDSIKSKAIVYVLKDFKKGDSLDDINAKLPGFFHFADYNTGKGSKGGEDELFNYNIEYENGKITKMEFQKVN